MNNSEIKEKLKNILPEKRYLHSIGVSETAETIAKMHNVCPKKAYLAGLLHDCAKMQTDEELLKSCREFKINLTPDDMASMQVLHGFVGAEIAKRDFSVSDTEILDAIRYHTTGKPNFSPLGKLIYLADKLECGRDYPSVDNLRATLEQKGVDYILVEKTLGKFGNKVEVFNDLPIRVQHLVGSGY